MHVTHLTAYRSGDDVVLHWGADPDFAGTYTIYHSSQYAIWPDGGWEIRVQNVPPTGTTTRDLYVHAGAGLNLDSQYYTVVRICP